MHAGSNPSSPVSCVPVQPDFADAWSAEVRLSSPDLLDFRLADAYSHGRRA